MSQVEESRVEGLKVEELKVPVFNFLTLRLSTSRLLDY